jgi:hypothetical protein
MLAESTHWIDGWPAWRPANVCDRCNNLWRLLQNITKNALRQEKGFQAGRSKLGEECNGNLTLGPSTLKVQRVYLVLHVPHEFVKELPLLFWGHLSQKLLQLLKEL